MRSISALLTALCLFSFSITVESAPIGKKVLPSVGGSFRDCPQCPEMQVLPAGSFVLDAMGNARTVSVARPFALGKYEVTFEEWDACVAAGGCGGYRPSDEGWGRGRQPVMNISWHDANLYVQWLSQKTGRQYRLPTEAEWEYAARGGLSPQHLRGEVPGSAGANCDNCVGQWGNIQTAPVGRLEANVFGLFDMQGNIWEWVDDCADCDCQKRILRGAALGNGKAIARASRRVRNSASDRNGHAGLRVALSDGDPPDSGTEQKAAEGHMVGTLFPVQCDKVEPPVECKPVREVYRVEILEKPFVLEGAYFDTDKAILKPEGKEKLDEVARFAHEYPGANLKVTGHTDSSGSAAWNWELSAARAESAKSYLVERGVEAERISTQGVAATQPRATNETVEGRAQNRRVEIRSTVRVEKTIREEQP